jgi:hypothetical protein
MQLLLSAARDFSTTLTTPIASLPRTKEELAEARKHNEQVKINTLPTDVLKNIFCQLDALQL